MGETRPLEDISQTWEDIQWPLRVPLLVEEIKTKLSIGEGTKCIVEDSEAWDSWESILKREAFLAYYMLST